MPKLTQTTDLTPEPTVVIEPKLRQALQVKLTAYAAVATQIKALEAKKSALAKELGALRDETGEMSVKLEGYGTVTLIASTYKSFNPKKFVMLGGELEIYNQAVEDKLKKAYDRITLPGADTDAA